MPSQPLPNMPDNTQSPAAIDLRNYYTAVLDPAFIRVPNNDFHSLVTIPPGYPNGMVFVSTSPTPLISPDLPSSSSAGYPVAWRVPNPRR